ncbi:MAG: hypothetical protein CMF41_06010 [Legionellales bacterium]|nr:hypothetical protein [Legionellales bacterium]OUX64267.1 MAG: hypothetical protein CBE41_03625 [Gammaproteobacteria bacterium TMED281]
MKRIAIVATGDEVVSGDILNRNTQEIASLLESDRMIVKTHLSVRDDLGEIIHSIEWLMQQHEAIILTGGLGPTIDDLTAQAISELTNMPLEFHEHVWEFIQKVYQDWNKICMPINKKQAFFPKNAQLIENNVGTAFGFYIRFKEKAIFVLPGPPKECMPMLKKVVIPQLRSEGFSCAKYRHTWFVLGVGESAVAEKLEPVCKSQKLSLSFRTGFPYVEVKIFTDHATFDDHLIVDALQGWIYNREYMGFSKLFFSDIKKLQHSISFQVDEKDHWMLQWLPEWNVFNGDDKITLSSDENKVSFSRNNQIVEYQLSNNKTNEAAQEFLMEWVCYHCLNAI